MGMDARGRQRRSRAPQRCCSVDGSDHGRSPCAKARTLRYAAIAHTINPETGRDVFIEALKNTRRLRLPKD